MTNATKHFLTIDNGGTNTKVIIVDQDGRQLSVSSFPTDAIERRPGFREVNPGQMWRDIGKAVKAALESAGLDGSQIDGVVPVGHGKGLYVLGKDGKPFMDGILSSDSRAADLANEFESRVAEIYPISHQHVMVMQFPVLLRWLKDNEPEQYARIGHVLSNKDFIRHFLTGEILEERGDASGNNLVNLETGEYDGRLFDFFGIPEMLECMPKLVSATDRCGSIAAEAAANTGLAEGTPVYAGLFDIDACALATGVLSDDIFSITAGTWNINVFPSKTMAPLDGGCMNSVFPTGDTLVEASSPTSVFPTGDTLVEASSPTSVFPTGDTLVEASSPTSAGNLDYVLRMMTADGSKAASYDELGAMLERTDAKYTDVLFFPFLYGSNVNLGAEGAFIGLRSSSERDQLLRAVYEGVVFAHRHHVEQLLRVLGHKPKAIRISGGVCNSDPWVQMFADVLNLPVETVAVTELGGLGGAMCAAVGSGLYGSFQEAFGNMSKLAKRFEPHADQTAVYDRKFEAYEALLTALDGGWAALRDMQNSLER